MGDNPFFKMKSSKRSNPETKTTLDALHNQRINTYIDDINNVNAYKSELQKLNALLEDTKSYSDIYIWKIEQDIERLQNKIKTIESNSNIMNYYLRSGDILFNYYDIQDQIQQGSSATTTTNKAKPGSILAILGEVANEENDTKKIDEIEALNSTLTPVKSEIQNGPKKKTLQRSELLNEYLQIEDPMKAKSTYIDNEDPWTICEDCGNEMIMCMNEANITCPKCGHQEFIIVDSDKPSYKDPPREATYYAYKKINHFNEWLAQFQAKESTEIPQDIYDQILLQLKKERISNMTTLKPSKIREILRNLKCSKYYEHIPHIINRLNGQNAPFISREDEEKLRHMFREIQPSFKKHCPLGRRNFLSYGYVLYKFCELLEMDEFLACFPLLKNRDKLYLQDKIWQKICEDMSWQFIRTV
jgi:hypothetical protein